MLEDTTLIPFRNLSFHFLTRLSFERFRSTKWNLSGAQNHVNAVKEVFLVVGEGELWVSCENQGYLAENKRIIFYQQSSYFFVVTAFYIDDPGQYRRNLDAH